MELHPSNEPIADPFFREVRRRHPDVDIVLLPPEAATPAAPPMPDEAVSEALVRLATRGRRLWASIAPGDPEEPEARYRFGRGPDSVRPVTTLSATREDGYALLVRLRHELESDGWELRRPEGTVERLTGALGELDVTASYAEEHGAFVFSMTGPSMPVGAERARELTGGGTA